VAISAAAVCSLSADEARSSPLRNGDAEPAFAGHLHCRHAMLLARTGPALEPPCERISSGAAAVPSSSQGPAVQSCSAVDVRVVMQNDVQQ
jgi:hypothetical protein